MLNQIIVYAQIISEVQTQVKYIQRSSVNTQSHVQYFYLNAQVTYVYSKRLAHNYDCIYPEALSTMQL